MHDLRAIVRDTNKDESIERRERAEYGSGSDSAPCSGGWALEELKLAVTIDPYGPSPNSDLSTEKNADADALADAHKASNSILPLPGASRDVASASEFFKNLGRSKLALVQSPKTQNITTTLPTPPTPSPPPSKTP